MHTNKYRFKNIIGLLPLWPRALRILDIGTTPFTLFVKQTFPNYEISSVDLTDVMEDRCKRANIQFKKCDLARESIPFGNDYFDVVIFTEVLEHLFAPPSKVLREIRRVMCGGGRLLLSVPNIATLYNRLRLLLGITPLGYLDAKIKDDWIHGHGHLHEYTMHEIASILETCNFKISKREYLQPNVADGVRHAAQLGFPVPLAAIYYLVSRLVPSFRATICIDCYKPT